MTTTQLGGDVGRVYVGTGSENIALAKKVEVAAVDIKSDTHIGRLDNPHSVTKAQVGLEMQIILVTLISL